MHITSYMHIISIHSLNLIGSTLYCLTLHVYISHLAFSLSLVVHTLDQFNGAHAHFSTNWLSVHTYTTQSSCHKTKATVAMHACPIGSEETN